MVVTVDEKGRVLIPRKARAALGIAPGDALFLDVGPAAIRLAKIENPFDALAAEALGEHAAGRTRTLAEFAAEHELSLGER